MNEPQFKTERFKVRLYRVSDAKKLLDLHTLNREFFRPFDPPMPIDFFTLDYWKNKIQNAQNAWLEKSQIRFLIVDLDEKNVIGTINFTQLEEGPFQCCRLGYKLSKESTGQGIMTEALKLCIDFIFEELNFHRIEANYLVDNKKSAGVLSRCGFVEEGLAKKYLYINEDWQDHILTSLTNLNWKNKFISTP